MKYHYFYISTVFFLCGLSQTVLGQWSQIAVSDKYELVSACTEANNRGGYVEIILEDGTYEIGYTLYVQVNNVTFRGKSGKRENVIIKGGGMYGSIPHIFLIGGSNVFISDMTIGWVRNHGIQVNGPDNADNFQVKNVHFKDTYEQMLKASAGGSASADNGIVENCMFEYTAGIGPQYYTGGIDVHNGANWIIKGNSFYHIRSPESRLAEHAVHFWNNSSGTIVERNVIVNCDRGIGFGLGTSGHSGGIIRNNMVHTNRDVGIGLESSPGTKVFNNTVYTENYFNSIEYRFATTIGVMIINNLTNKNISSRNGATGTLTSNITNAPGSWFTDPTLGDMHLVMKLPEVCDRGSDIPDVTYDIDNQPRPEGRYDIGADEFYNKGDCNFDDICTLEDIIILSEHWLKACKGPYWCMHSDFDRDGTVDLNDMRDVSENWLVNFTQP